MFFFHLASFGLKPIVLEGLVQSSNNHSIPIGLLSWLNNDHGNENTSDTIFMQTKYKIQEETCKELVRLLQKLMNHSAGTGSIRILWSLRKSQQETLQHLLLTFNNDQRIKIVEFTPQAEVLKYSTFILFCVTGCCTGIIIFKLLFLSILPIMP